MDYLKSQINKTEPGEILQWKNYLSTSLSFNYAEEFMGNKPGVMYLFYSEGKFIDNMKNEVLINKDKEFVYIGSEFLNDYNIYLPKNQRDNNLIEDAKDVIVIKLVEKDILVKSM